MWHLMKNEWMRFRGLTITLAMIHLVVLGSVATSGELFSGHEDVMIISGLIYCISGLLVGLYQIGSYRRRHLWTYLLHRPLPPARIFLALAGAATSQFLVVFIVPLFVVTLLSDLSTWQWVDARHYLLLPFALGTLLVFYLIGCYIMLSPSRAAFLVLVLPLFFLTDEAIGRWIFFPLLLVIIWLGYLAFASFKPDLSAHLKRPVAVMLAALPVQYVFFWVLHIVFLSIYSFTVAFAEEGWRSFARHGWDDYFAAGTYDHLDYLPTDRAMAHGLRQMDSELAAPWLAKLEGVHINDLLPRRHGVGLAKPPTRGQLLFMDHYGTWYDDKNANQWTFSHDTMRFRGRDSLSRDPIGWLGTTGSIADAWAETPAFSEIPSMEDEGLAHTRQQIYRFDFARRQFSLQFEVSGGERFLNAWAEHESFATVLSDRALYIFAGADRSALAKPTVTAAWQGTVRNLGRMLVARLSDGYLVSTITGKNSQRGHEPARQTVTWFSDSGDSEIIADQRLTHGPPPWSRHRGFIVSPALQFLHDVAWSALEPYGHLHCGLKNSFRWPSSRSAVLSAFILALISGLLTAWVARRRGLGANARRGWTAAGFFIGLPAFFSFLFLTPANNS